jgi:hypothetical protein
MDECDACGFRTKTKSYERQSTRFKESYRRKNPGKNVPKQALCDVCANTMSGNAYDYGYELHPEGPILAMVAYCTNLILKEISNLREKGKL